ncbi:MAG TPA: hypothetical protein VGG85_09445 [Terracidiphilus sp.]
MGWVKGVVPHTTSGKAVTVHSPLSPTLMNHVALRASHRIASHAKRKAYEELQREREEKAKYWCQMEMSSSYSHHSPEHWKHLEDLAADASNARNETKEQTREAMPEWLRNAVMKAEGEGHRAKKKSDREGRHPMLNLESSTRTNPDPTNYFRWVIDNWLKTATLKEAEEAVKFANSWDEPPTPKGAEVDQD